MFFWENKGPTEYNEAIGGQTVIDQELKNYSFYTKCESPDKKKTQDGVLIKDEIWDLEANFLD